MRLVSPRRTILPASVFLLCCLFTQPARADDAEIQKQIAHLADRSADDRQEAIEALGQTRDERVAKVLQAFQQGHLYARKDPKAPVVLSEETTRDAAGKRLAVLLDPLTRQPLLDPAGKPLVVDSSSLRDLSPSRQERRLLANVIRFLEDFASSDPDKRLAAVRRFGESPDASFLAPLEQVAESDADPRVRRAARESAALTRLLADVPDQTAEQRLAAVTTLGSLHSVQGRKVLQDLVQQGGIDAKEVSTCQDAIKSIERYQFWVGLGRDLTNGLSAGSVLILMALGLSIIYGQMGVINMAHGELMMVGAYATFETQRLFGHTPEHPVNIYYAAALPVSFFAAAAIGWLIELVVVRHLYGRVLETLLATWGVGLILVQAARVRYGDNIGVNSPSWLVGSFELMPDFAIPYARCFILLLCMLCVAFLHCLMNYTRIGLKVRATVQGRETAESLGVCTRRVDGFTFALGAGLAGVAGYALTLIAGVTPDMGQNYVVDSFLVVVVGGVGKLAGSVWAGLGIGSINKMLEPATFGTALLALGLAMAVVSWIALTIRAFRAGPKWGWLTLLLPIPLPFALKFWSRKDVPKLTVVYGLGVAAAVVGFMRATVLTDWLSQDIRTVWARVLILLVVVIFIQWRPAGLFPPKGRLADV